MDSGVNYFRTLFRSENEAFANILDMFMLIDIGTVTSIEANNRVTIQSCKIIGGTPVTFSDVEVIGIGNHHGGIMSCSVGSTCLLFVPRTTMPDINNQKINMGAALYSKDGIKALPITNGNDADVLMSVGSEGNLNIKTDTYTWVFSKDSISLLTEAGLTYQIASDSSYLLYRYTADSDGNPTSGKFWQQVDNNGYELCYITKAKDSKTTFTLKDDGTINLVHIKPASSTSEQDEVLGSISLAADGGISIVGPTKNVTIGIDNTGAITISTDKDISVSTDGNIALSASKLDVNSGHLQVS